MQDVEEYAIIQPSSDVWDEFVARHANAHALQSAAWAGLKAYVGWLPQHGIVAGASLLFRRRYGVSVGYVPRGPLLSGEQSIDDLLFTALRRVAKSMRAVLLRIEPNILENAPGTGQLHSAMLLRGMRVADTIQPRSSIHLELGPAPEKLLAAMSKGHRADVRRAAREGVSVRWGAGEAELDTLYSILSDTARRAQFGIHERDYYRAVLAQFGEVRRRLLHLLWAGVARHSTCIAAQARQALRVAHNMPFSGKLFAGRKNVAANPTISGASPMRWARPA